MYNVYYRERYVWCKIRPKKDNFRPKTCCGNSFRKAFIRKCLLLSELGWNLGLQLLLWMGLSLIKGC